MMFETREKIDTTMVITVANPTVIVKGHPVKQGAGVHSDKRFRRTNRKSRNNAAIREF
jgi:hypothetical protein